MVHSIQIILFMVSFGSLFTYINWQLNHDLCSDVISINETMNWSTMEQGWSTGGSGVQSAVKMQQCKNLKENTWWVNYFVWIPISVAIIYAVIPFIKGG